ncbi:MAG TPA: methylmalonyl Co-A mutase-associated GTPase MeaB [Myxococcaceae bacterium]|nr:methylmalonyl Co-A mutase-associated GTPase MeaB [Myxococcaceae bacterium]
MSSLVERVLAGEVRAASRLMRRIDDEDPAAIADLQALFPRTGRAYVLGITGSPGAGKSTLTDRVVARFRAQGKSVGVLAVDPTSPFSGGAILGDRIRMQDHASDPAVFIRSLATRGSLGGLSRATGDCIRVMDAMGKDVIVVETVGVGQDEIDIAQMAHTTMLVTVPGMGDDIQAIKAGILEVADAFIVNKADLDGADRTVRELRQMLELRHALRRPSADHDRHHRTTARAAGKAAEPPPPAGPEEWEPPILKVIAARDQGLEPVMEAVERHRSFLERTGQKAERERARARMQFLALLRNRLLESALGRLEAEKGRLDEVALSIARREADPYALAETLARQLSA